MVKGKEWGSVTVQHCSILLQNCTFCLHLLFPSLEGYVCFSSSSVVSHWMTPIKTHSDLSTDFSCYDCLEQVILSKWKTVHCLDWLNDLRCAKNQKRDVFSFLFFQSMTYKEKKWQRLTAWEGCTQFANPQSDGLCEGISARELNLRTLKPPEKKRRIEIFEAGYSDGCFSCCPP